MIDGGPIRLLEERDLAELVELCREHAHYERAVWIERDRARDLGRMFLESTDAHAWVASGEGELAGFASATLERSTWEAGHFLHLDCLFLRPAYRGAGLGRGLMREVAATAQRLGALNLQWQTPAWNEGAVRFYARLGATSAPKLRFTMEPEEFAELAGTDVPR